MKKFILLLFFIALNNLLYADYVVDESNGLSYKSIEENNHIIHILEINPKKYSIELVKAHNQVFGRETVYSIARRKNAVAAINAGFIEIGNSEEGRPSGTLVINGRILNVIEKLQNLLILNDQIYIEKITPKILFSINDTTYPINKINNFASDQGNVLYTSDWGVSTLTPYTRMEILINSNNEVQEISSHGDNYIPKNGYILSLPFNTNIFQVNVGDKVNFMTRLTDIKGKNSFVMDNRYSCVMGVPIIVENGKKVDNFMNLGDHFANHPHARTAVGIKNDGNILFVVAEHRYSQDLKKVTLEQVQEILKAKNYSKVRLSLLTLPELKELVKKHFTHPTGPVGLTLPELAKFMVNLKCDKAINLDGGGSSSMFYEDENLGIETLRPVSDAIIIKNIK
jgi:exopolysaccharide biosynthesis protein